MPRHLISDAHEWINEIPTVPIYYLAKPQPRERAWQNQRGKKTLETSGARTGIISTGGAEFNGVYRCLSPERGAPSGRGREVIQTGELRAHARSNPMPRVGAERLVGRRPRA